jgi:hypothetical protein
MTLDVTQFGPRLYEYTQGTIRLDGGANRTRAALPTSNE